MLKLKKLMEEEGVADKDMKAAKKLRPDLEKAVQNLENLMFTINKKVSSFNAPGVRTAFADAILAGLKVKKQAFVAGAARKVIDKYFSGR